MKNPENEGSGERQGTLLRENEEVETKFGGLGEVVAVLSFSES